MITAILVCLWISVLAGIIMFVMWYLLKSDYKEFEDMDFIEIIKSTVLFVLGMFITGVFFILPLIYFFSKIPGAE